MADYSQTTSPTPGGSNGTWGATLNTILGEISGGFTGSSTISPDLKFENWQIAGVAVTTTAAELNKLDGISGNLLTDAQTDTLTAGYSVTPHDAGTVTSGTYTVDPADSNLQYVTNNGAHTLAPPASDCTVQILYTNAASAGAVTTSGFTAVNGAFTTTNGDQFLVTVTRINSVSILNIQAI